MNTQVDYISINKDFWIQLKEGYVSFGSDKLPYKSHFTISFNNKKSDINFHITKNALDPKDKPKIGVVEISKQILEEDTDLLIRKFLNRLLKPIDIENLKLLNENKIAFISSDTFQQEQHLSQIEKKFIKSFDSAYKFQRKSRLKFKGEIASRLERFSETLNLQHLIVDNLSEIPDNYNAKVESGVILTENESMNVLRINEKWFSVNNELSLLDFICTFTSPKIAIQLKWKTNRAIISMKDALKYSDTLHLDKPMRLVRKSVNINKS